MTTTAQTIKTSNLTSADPTIAVPTEVHVLTDGSAIACHADSGDVRYESLADLEAAYQIDVPAGEE